MTIEESIAKLNLGEMRLSQFPVIAMSQLENGIESESLIILAGMSKKDNSFEIKEYLNKVIEELNVSVYKSNDAAFILANFYVQEYKSGKTNINEAISRIKNDCWENSNVEIENTKYIYDSIKFEKVIGTWYEYNEIDEHTDWVKRSKKSFSHIKVEMEEELISDLLLWESEFLKNKIAEIKT